MTKRSMLAAGLVSVALLAAGCGDDDDEPTTTSTTSGASGATGASGAEGGSLPADVVADGNQICEDGDKELDKAFGALGDGQPSDKEFEQVVTDTLIPNVQGQIDDLRELDDSDELQSVLDEAEGILGDLEEDPQLIQEGDPFEPINSDLTALGLTECAD